MHPIENDNIDTLNEGVYITVDRMEAFQFTNAHSYINFLAIYAQQVNNTQFVTFSGMAAGIVLDVYVLTLVVCCILIILFASIAYLRQSHEFNWWDMTTAIVPCFYGQAQQLQK